MDQPDNVRQSDSLRVGLIADAEGVARLGPALASAPVEIVAQSGMRQPAALPDAEWFDDARVMISRSGVEALLLAISPRAAFELDALAADRKLPIWRLPPLARNFAEATELAGRVRERKTPYRVASWWEAIGEHVRWGLRWREGFKPLLTNLQVAVAGPGLDSWRSSQVDAPGGVLATDAYFMLEALVAVRKLPDTVRGAALQVRRRPDQAPRETEGAVTAILDYEGGGAASLLATWDVHPFGLSCAHHGAQCSVVLEPQRVSIHGSEGELLDERTFDPNGFLGEDLQRFVADVREGHAPESQERNIERHTAVTACLQAIYLSARTGQPESPKKLYEVQQWPEPRL
ncbi:MAG: hypothetical protein PVJ57_09205 [Phycisphaerae bacterium]|jgi:predicted dehydrogenase